MNKLFNTATLYLVGAVTGLGLGLYSLIVNAIPAILAMALWGLVFWLTFNFGVGSVIGIQITFIQAFCFVWMVRVLSETVVNGNVKNKKLIKED